MDHLNLDINIRASLAQQILTALEDATQGSMAQLRGSLADGRADPYSDIDVSWEVPDELFQSSVGRLSKIMSEIHPVESLRSAPDFQNSDKRRLVFVQFEGIPLFWRVDLDIFAQSIQKDYGYDLDNQAARGNDWSLAHSALMNAIAAVRALLRNREEQAKQLLVRGFQRVGHVVPQDNPRALILRLAEGVAVMDPTKAGLVQRIVELHRWAFEQDRGA